jgi:signal peptidase I
MEKQNSSARKEIFSVLRDFAVILAFVTVLFVFAVRLVGVDGSSMFPTLMNKDYMLLLSNVVSQDYEKGDVVVLTVPEFSEGPIVKRIIATEGDLVDIDYTTGDVYVNGERLDEDYISEKIWAQYDNSTDFPVTVPDGCVFVLGDNRNRSADSRYAPIGMVDTRRIMGRVLGVALPAQETDIEGRVIGGRDFSRVGGLN